MEHSPRSSQLIVWGLGKYYSTAAWQGNESGGGTRSSPLSTAKWLLSRLLDISQGGIALGLPGKDCLERGSILVLGW